MTFTFLQILMEVKKLSIHWLMLQSQKLSPLQACIRSKKTLLQKSTQFGLSPQSLVKIKR